MKKVSGLILKLMGWKIIVNEEFMLKKAVVIMAPHTSNMDFWIGRLAFWKLTLPVRFLIKKEMFRFPLGVFLKAMGAIPVDRKNSGNIIEEIVNLFNERDKLCFTITPEGTRKLNHNWKKGFYQIATKANVPILLGYVDYKYKTGGIGMVIFPSGNFEKDMEIITDFYKTVNAKYPENFNLSEMNRKQL